MFVYLTLACLAVAVASAAGGMAPLVTVLTHTRLQLYLSFAAGVMLGAVFFHMLPEAVSTGGSAMLPWTAAGLLCLFFLERFFSFHEHEIPLADADADAGPASSAANHHGHAHPHNHTHSNHRTSLNWGAAGIGLAIHTLVGGFALASASDTSADPAAHGTALGVLLATLVHKPADALTIVSLMVRAGVDRGRAHLVNLGFSLLLPLGVILYFLGRGILASAVGERFTSAALAFSGGTFLCIALSDLLPELHFHEHDRLKLSIALLSGVGLMALTATAL